MKPAWKKESRFFAVRLAAATAALLLGAGGTAFALRVFYFSGSFLGPYSLLRAALFSPAPIALGVWLLYGLSGSAAFRRRLLGAAWWFFTALYCMVLAFVLFGGGRRDYDYSYLKPNLSPFLSLVREFKSAFSGRFDMRPLMGLMGNLALFFPLGFLLPWKMKGRYPRLAATLLLLAAIVAVESLQQLLVVGVFDIDDILLNFTGMLLGAAMQSAVQKTVKKRTAAAKDM
ncbi:MAG: VanZ family protein [Clostridiaceae bacterium]|nr:VanZ family protein [Eubacteriales bacterium]